MPPPLFIALHLIGHRKKAILLSLTGVVLGVAFYVCVQAQTQGFEHFFVKSVLGSSGAIVIQDRFQARYSDLLAHGGDTVVSVSHVKPRKYYEGVSDATRLTRILSSFSNVAASSPFIEGNATLTADFRQEVIRLHGIDLDQHLRATALQQQIVNGDLLEFRAKPSGAIVGFELARKLGIRVGQDVTLSGPDAEPRSFRVCAIFQTGNNIIDERRVLIQLRTAQDLFKKPATISTILVKLYDPSRAPQQAAHIERLLQHRSRSWQERERGNLQIFNAIRISAAITVSTIILLAGFGIFNILTLMVLDKAREIAVLRSMGYRRTDISAIFLWQGFLVALIGSVLGCALGAGLTYAISRIPVKIRGFLVTDHFLVHWSMEHYLVATLIAFVAVFLASYFPSRRAARLAPVTILRGGGQ